jgi:predicted deacylase
MADKSYIINNTPIPAGKKTEIQLYISRLPTHTDIFLPAYCYRGKSDDGPTILLTAGLHGDEINGIEILRRMVAENMLMPDRGMVIVMPLVNIYGFLQNSRGLPDGKDLNRSFPGSKRGSLAQRVAHTMLNDILPHIDFGIDFHTGGASRINYPQVRCAFESEHALSLARQFRAPYILKSRLIDKSFRKAASRKKKDIIVYESGESLRYDELGIRFGIEGALRVMKARKMIDYAPYADPSIELIGSKWLRARYAGLFHSKVSYGDEVTKGQIIGSITDPYGDWSYKIKSSVSGFVIGMNHFPVMNAGDAIFHIGYK